MLPTECKQNIAIRWLVAALWCYYSAITDAIRLVDCSTVRCLVGHILLTAGGLLCVILLIKEWFDRKESRAKQGKDDGKNKKG